MRLARYIFILVLALLATYSFGWYYLANKAAGEINTKYAGKKISIEPLINGQEYTISFDKASASGFPFALSINLHNWQEESKGSLISYKEAVSIGYNLLSQVAYISYNGDVDAAYKPVSNGFGAVLKINDYMIKVSLPLTGKLFKTIPSMQDFAELINYIGEITISTKEVQIFDKQEDELFYNKEYEKLKFSFTTAKYYKSLDEIINDIPKEYEIHYSAQTKPVKFRSRRIPVSLFYGFALMPSDFKISGVVNIKTKAKTIKEFASDIEAKADVTFSASKVDLTSFKLAFNGDLDLIKGRNTKLLIDGKFRTKDGLFESLFKQYESIKPKILGMPAGAAINQEMTYIIANKEAFRFKDLENSDYNFNIDMVSSHSKNNAVINVNNLSIYSGDSGFKLTHESTMKQSNLKDWNAKGVLLVKNYPSVVEFSSGYIYRFGKFRFLNDEARSLYVDVNKTFLKTISDHPASSSGDLSFDYTLDSSNLPNGKIGSTQVDKIPDLYYSILYKKLFAMIDPAGDLLSQMKKILPDLNENEPLFKKLLPVISGKDIKEILPKEVEKIIPDKIKDLPTKDLKDKIGKELLKKLGQ